LLETAATGRSPTLAGPDGPPRRLVNLIFKQQLLHSALAVVLDIDQG
jgi:hypothetical protein